jgi:hypothetical protein
MQANLHRCCRPTAARAVSGVRPLRASPRTQGKLRSDLHIVDGLVSVTRRTWRLGLRVEERVGGE